MSQRRRLIMIKEMIHMTFSIYTWMLIARIVSSWFPNLSKYRAMHFLYFYTDPYLNLFRKFIPPVGGMLDLSPMIGFFALRFFEILVMNIL